MAAGVPEMLPPAATVPPAYREPACRNCGAPAGEAFCPRCGQETATRLPSARQFLKEAAGRYVALDGRLCRTLAALLFRPGFLTLEYLAGRRRCYVRPSRLFLVLSLALFAAMRLFLGMPQGDDAFVIDVPDRPEARVPAVPGAAPNPADPGVPAPVPRKEGERSAALVAPGLSITFDEQGNVGVNGPGWFADVLRARVERFNALPRQERVEQVLVGMMRYGPYAMFVLLPAFAVLLTAVYAGRARHHPDRPRGYAAHLVFAAHSHAFFFLAVTMAVIVPWPAAKVTLLLWSLGYGLWALRRVYGGPWIGVLARAWVVAVAYFVLFVFATLGLLLAAVVLR